MPSLYQPGTSPLHRAPAGAKLLALALICVAATVAESLAAAAALAALCAVGYLAAGLGLGALGRQLWRCRWIAAFLVVAQILFQPLATTVATTARIVLLIALAALVTATTRTDDLLDCIVRLLGPFERFGADPERVSLAFALTLSAVPLVAASLRAVREAASARGATGPAAIAGQAAALVVLCLKQADDLADALSARGL